MKNTLNNKYLVVEGSRQQETLINIDVVSGGARHQGVFETFMN